MARNYKRKSNRGSYNKADLHSAVQAVRNGNLSGYKASKLYKIPRMTIMDHVYNKRQSNTPGRKTALPLDIERNIASCLHIMERYGFGMSRTEVANIIGEYVNQNNLSTRFKNGIPGKDWLEGFQNRHNLSVKKPQAVEYARKTAVDPFIVYGYFDLLKKTITELGLQDKPNAIWNLDETSFSKDPSKTKIVGLKGHAATRTISTPGKDNTTVLLGASAAGEKTPPLIIFKGKYVWDSWTSPDAYPETSYAATKNGWMESEVFEAFFKKSFLPAIGDQRPVLLIYDGHATHVGINIIEAARKENITIIKLPAHTSHLLQPLDISVMKSFKDRWDVVLVKWQRLNIGVPLPKKEFSRLIGSVWAEIEPQILRNGFIKAGIYPLNPTAVEESKFDALKLSRWKEHTTKMEQKNPKTLHSIVLSFINKKIMITDQQIEDAKLTTHSDFSYYESESTHEKKSDYSFEKILLEKIQRGDNSTKAKRCRVAPGAEVITHDDVLNMKIVKQVKNIKQEKCQKQKKITLLSEIQKTSSESQPFTAKDKKNLPSCLQVQKSENSDIRVKILSNILLNPVVPQPGPSGVNAKGSKKRKEVNQITKNTKGKGTGKKSRGKENIAINQNRKHHHKLMKKNKNYSSTSSSTSLSGIISSHSDSDLLQCESDFDFDINDVSLFEDTELAPTETTLSRDEEIYPSSNLTIDETERNEETESIISTNKIMSNENDIEQPHDNTSEKYSVEDYVLVRYYGNKWKYYIGVIEAIQDAEQTEPCFSINFFKTIKKPKLTFRVQKKKDHDVVPELSIVKKVQLSRDSEKINDFFLINQEDLVYFC